MPATGPRRRREDVAKAVDLSELYASVAGAALEAKALLDHEAAALAEEYGRDPLLGSLSPPSFAIGEIRFVVRYAVASVELAPASRRGKGGRPRLSVHVDTASLAETAPHLISEVELRIVPEVKRPQASEAEIDSVE